MDFVDWDAAAAGTGFDLPAVSEDVTNSPEAALASDQPDMDLVFQDIDGDEWANWAIEHFTSTQIASDTGVPADPNGKIEGLDPCATMYWETPETPCNHCAVGGYQCKRIREGKYEGYCTSCVALRCGCSFGPLTNNLTAEAGATFPANPWPIMGDRPETSILLEDDLAAIINSEAPGLVSVADENAEKQPPPQNPQNMPKIGARFSRESVKILKNWVSTHSKHPYPTEEEKENLQRMTGLSKTQITNWLANARRRGKIHVTRATSPHIGRGYAQAIDIPQRPGTPSLFANMNPLQRWAHSPPENEPASVTAIAQAVSASYSQTSSTSGRNSPYISTFSDDGSSRSLCNQSSASSFGTSHSSGGSFASSFSHNSRGSSVPSFVRTRGRRRRRRAPPKRAEETLSQPLKTFQCTFCTETFRTKHDWQRHEKSLHLSLERWVCCPNGPRDVNPENNALSCVFCGLVGPDDAHVESHNYSGCIERTKEERTFYRKDHLRQHLKLVHNVKFLQWSMDKWRVNSPEIRSRCGFCGIIMDSWSMRVDHLAEHFKTGNTMADWKGDWGFEPPVLQMVENSIPPYMIHDERQTPLPYMASHSAPWTPSNAYELLKVELQYWISNRINDTGNPPTDAEIQYEACRVIFSADALSRSPSGIESSWLRDLVMSSDEVTGNAVYRPIRNSAEGCMSALRINGKNNIFEDCPFERQLQEYVKARELLGLTAMDQELQVEACRIIGRTEESSSNPSDQVANWLLRLIHNSPKWLEGFRRRAHLPRSEDIVDVDKRSKDAKTIDSTIYNYSRLERELAEFLQAQRSLGTEPTDAALQRQARVIIYDIDDEWNQTAADDREWLSHFRQRHPPLEGPLASTSSGPLKEYTTTPSLQRGSQSSIQGPDTTSSPLGSGSSNTEHLGGSAFSNTKNTQMKMGALFNDANCYRRLARCLSRFVASTMSTNNPNRHVPTDEELRHQARWIVYDDDDIFNQTGADNDEWLLRFKRDVGLLPKESGPGLNETDGWHPREGGTGFAPPYVYPNPQSTIEPLRAAPKITLGGVGGEKNGQDEEAATTTTTTPPFQFEPDAATATHFLQHLTRRYPAPAKVFCSRELESGLAEYVRRELHRSGRVFPSDDDMRERARQILGMEKTPCDDPVLLGKFKAAIQGTAVGMPVPSSSSLMIGGGSLSAAMAPYQQQLSPAISGITAGLRSMTAAAPVDPTNFTSETTTAMDVDLADVGEFSFSEQELDDLLLDISPTGSGSVEGTAQPPQLGSVSPSELAFNSNNHSSSAAGMLFLPRVLDTIWEQ
ncbi:hypothetical protein DL764_000252 [Monosporascus ibericus]|uniref:Homeobox domain-containing protein n=1 Tax=Monosporascus ibericus TaxID=155417 RepID=A0A4Q4TWV1_9PEZI|nr:hypothetical protein DL764_000252 [Monosporascus ibericus]